MLRLVEEEDGLWSRYQEGRWPLGGALVERWERVARLGVRADGPAPPDGVAAPELAVRRSASFEAFADASSIVDALSSEARSRGLLALVADRHGVIVHARGGDAFPREISRTRLVEGARWDEGARGTNAIGTAIVERQAVAVVGRAHWERVNHGIFCYAAPISDPFGELVAVLDVTGPLSDEETAIGVAVRSAAKAIEEVLRARARHRSDAGSLALLSRMVERCSEPSLLVEAPGVVRAANEAAEVELELPRGPVRVERVFGMSWAELVVAARSGPAAFETRRRRFTVEFEPVECEGRVLALACFLSPVAARTRPLLAPSAGDVELSAFDAIFAGDAEVSRAKRIAASLAPSEVPVLLLAATGTGKELFAHAIHRASGRAAKPFVAINCGALTAGLLETELFGYAPGAFTGASPRGSEGKLAAAHGGTLFLDEVAEMSAQAQAMLLRFLEDGSYQRVGDATARRADVRLLCATCRDLPNLVATGAFREDLFYRVNGGNIHLPLLRDRTDRLELARRLLEQVASSSTGPARDGARFRLGASAEAWVLDHTWPGNVRELKTALVHAVALATSGRGARPRAPVELSREHFPEPLIASPPPTGAALRGSRKGALRALADEALSRTGGNVSEAARVLGVARSTLYRMLARPERARAGAATAVVPTRRRR